MSRADTALVFWKHHAHGYEARLTPYGRAFAIARMVKGVPGIHYELSWIYGPRAWRPFQVFNLLTIQRMVDRWVGCHRSSLLARMPPDPNRVPFAFPWNAAKPTAHIEPDPVRTCPGCGRRWGLCDVTAPRAARQRGNAGWRCYRMTA